MPAYEAVIGLEVHVQARTESKMFCSCPNRFGAEPNTLVCPVCMGYPGVLPTPNREAIRKIVTAGLMCSCDIRKKSKFDRKSYFYPDMPKNYQLTQYDMPFCLNGRIHICGRGFSGEELPDKDIRLTRIHMEEDVAKLTHFGTHSGVDFNRAGVPLMEIVSEPDMRSPDEAYAYLTSLKQIIQYADISDCDMEKGQMRCDVNISIRERGSETFGTKVELKNAGSLKTDLSKSNEAYIEFEYTVHNNSDQAKTYKPNISLMVPELRVQITQSEYDDNLANDPTQVEDIPLNLPNTVTMSVNDTVIDVSDRQPTGTVTVGAGSTATGTIKMRIDDVKVDRDFVEADAEGNHEVPSFHGTLREYFNKYFNYEGGAGGEASGATADGAAAEHTSNETNKPTE